MILLSIFLYLILKGTVADQNDTDIHTGVQLWRVQGDMDEEVIDEFYDRARITEDIWMRNSKTIDFLINENETAFLTEFLKKHKVKHKVLIQNVRGNIDESLIKKIPVRRAVNISLPLLFEFGAVEGDTFTWLQYPYLNDINRYLVKVISTYSCATITSLGWTFKSNPISMIKISNKDPKNDAILIDGGTHGMDFNSVMSTLYFIESIVKNFSSQPVYVQNKDWYIIPVLNPDGYEFSMFFDRNWRKNRRKFRNNCIGVDLNKNFNSNWSLTQNKCDSFYSGPNSFSEVETKAFKKLVDRVQFKAYLSIHSSGLENSSVLRPEDIDQELRSEDESIRFAKEMALAMSEASNIQYRDGCVKTWSDFSAASAMEWMYYIKHVNQTYQIEARSMNADDYTERKQIETVAKEVRAAILRLVELINEKK